MDKLKYFYFVINYFKLRKATKKNLNNFIN